MSNTSFSFLNPYKAPIFLALLFSSLACSTSSNQEKTFDQIITDKTWQLRYVSEDGLGIGAPYVDSLFTLQLSEEGSIGLKDHCNACGGAYEIDNSKISFKDMFCTLAVCNPTKIGIQLAGELEKVTDYKFVESELQLSYDSDGVVRTLHFADAAAAEPKKVILAGNNTSRDEDWENGPYNAEFININNDILTLKLGYSGCDIKDANMVFGNYFLESNPVQAHAFLPQPDQACLAYFEKEYQFDLGPLKKAFNDAYPETEGIIYISIREDDETLEQFRYEF